MSVPTSYTETELQNYIIAVLGGVATTLGLDITNVSSMGLVNDILFEYGVSDIASVTDIKKLRALAKVKAWRLALSTVSADYDYSDAGASYKRSQMFDQIEKNLAAAERDALPYLNQIEVQSLDYKNDPYEYHPAGTYVEDYSVE